jgi:hypothetical protein
MDSKDQTVNCHTGAPLQLWLSCRVFGYHRYPQIARRRPCAAPRESRGTLS